MTIKVKWNFFNSDITSTRSIESSPTCPMNMLGKEPVPALKYISTLKEVPLYIKCPAFTDFYKNAFIIQSPFNLEIEYNEQENNYIFKEFDSWLVNKSVTNRDHETSKVNSLITMPPELIFWSDSSVRIEILPCIFDTETEVGRKIKIIPGTFEIGKWYRPIDFTFEIHKKEFPLKIKRGDPILCVRFFPETGDKVILERTYIDKHIITLAAQMTTIKMVNRGFTLSNLYEIAEPAMEFYKKMKDKNARWWKRF